MFFLLLFSSISIIRIISAASIDVNLPLTADDLDANCTKNNEFYSENGSFHHTNRFGNEFSSKDDIYDSEAHYENNINNSQKSNSNPFLEDFKNTDQIFVDEQKDRLYDKDEGKKIGSRKYSSNDLSKFYHLFSINDNYAGINHPLQIDSKSYDKQNRQKLFEENDSDEIIEKIFENEKEKLNQKDSVISSASRLNIINHENITEETRKLNKIKFDDQSNTINFSNISIADEQKVNSSETVNNQIYDEAETRQLINEDIYDAKNNIYSDCRIQPSNNDKCMSILQYHHEFEDWEMDFSTNSTEDSADNQCVGIEEKNELKKQHNSKFPFEQLKINHATFSVIEDYEEVQEILPELELTNDHLFVKNSTTNDEFIYDDIYEKSIEIESDTLKNSFLDVNCENTVIKDETEIISDSEFMIYESYIPEIAKTNEKNAAEYEETNKKSTSIKQHSSGIKNDIFSKDQILLRHIQEIKDKTHSLESEQSNTSDEQIYLINEENSAEIVHNINEIQSSEINQLEIPNERISADVDTNPIDVESKKEADCSLDEPVDISESDTYNDDEIQLAHLNEKIFFYQNFKNVEEISNFECTDNICDQDKNVFNNELVSEIMEKADDKALHEEYCNSTHSVHKIQDGEDEQIKTKNTELREDKHLLKMNKAEYRETETINNQFKIPDSKISHENYIDSVHAKEKSFNKLDLTSKNTHMAQIAIDSMQISSLSKSDDKVHCELEIVRSPILKEKILHESNKFSPQIMDNIEQICKSQSEKNDSLSTEHKDESDSYKKSISKTSIQCDSSPLYNKEKINKETFTTQFIENRINASENDKLFHNSSDQLQTDRKIIFKSRKRKLHHNSSTTESTTKFFDNNQTKRAKIHTLKSEKSTNDYNKLKNNTDDQVILTSLSSNNDHKLNSDKEIHRFDSKSRTRSKFGSNKPKLHKFYRNSKLSNNNHKNFNENSYKDPQHKTNQLYGSTSKTNVWKSKCSSKDFQSVEKSINKSQFEMPQPALQFFSIDSTEKLDDINSMTVNNVFDCSHIHSDIDDHTSNIISKDSSDEVNSDTDYSIPETLEFEIMEYLCGVSEYMPTYAQQLFQFDPDKNNIYSVIQSHYLNKKNKQLKKDVHQANLGHNITSTFNSLQRNDNINISTKWKTENFKTDDVNISHNIESSNNNLKHNNQKDINSLFKKDQNYMSFSSTNPHTNINPFVPNQQYIVSSNNPLPDPQNNYFIFCQQMRILLHEIDAFIVQLDS